METSHVYLRFREIARDSLDASMRDCQICPAKQACLRERFAFELRYQLNGDADALQLEDRK